MRSENITPEDQSKHFDPYDRSYPDRLLSDGINQNFSRAQAAAKHIYDAVINGLPIAAQLRKTMEKGCRYVVDISERTLQSIEDGAIKLTQENGKTYAQIKINGKYGSKLPIKKEVFRKGLDAAQISGALQMQALQDQLQAVTEQLTLIGGNVKEILQGQQTDRIGLYHSGLALFLESQRILDPGLKTGLQAQALRSLAEATFQLKAAMQSDIHYLESKEYSSAKGKRKDLITNHMDSINRAFAYIHQATLLRAGIYCEIGEQAAMAQVLDEYSAFIASELLPHAELLSQYDLNDNGTQTGLWHSRARLKLDTSELSSLMAEPPKVLYLGIKKDDDSCEES